MMTSTFPSSRSNNSLSKYVPPREVESKKEFLKALEVALKKRINELRELCLKEGELTGQLPIDYPLQPREPIPQIRRRFTHSSNSNNNNHNHLKMDSISIIPPVSVRPRQQQQQQQLSNKNNQQLIMQGPQSALAMIPNGHLPPHSTPFPSRPTSTNSTSSSASTASSNTRSNNLILNNNSNNNNNNNAGHHQHLLNGSYSASSVTVVKPLQHYNINGVGNFQPYYEETKPFQMSDFYKYSSKYRQKLNGNNDNQQQQQQPHQQKEFKTTRQLQEDVMKKNSIRFSTCDDQIQASVRLIEKSGQKLIEATAKAIAGNPGLAEKLSNMLPNNNGER